MPLALGTAAIVLLALLCEVTRPTLRGVVARLRARRLARAHGSLQTGYDPGRERRAERRARALLRSCIQEEDWAMYRDLGFLRVWGALGAHASRHAPPPGTAEPTAPDRRSVDPVAPSPAAASVAAGGAPYAYLIYPHRPIVAYLPQTGTLLNEYCVAFPDRSRPFGSARLPDSDDVLAKWMALTADERRLIGDANMHLPGRQIDPDMVRRDLLRLSRWEKARVGLSADSLRAA